MLGWATYLLPPARHAGLANSDIHTFFMNSGRNIFTTSYPLNWYSQLTHSAVDRRLSKRTGHPLVPSVLWWPPLFATAAVSRTLGLFPELHGCVALAHLLWVFSHCRGLLASHAGSRTIFNLHFYTLLTSSMYLCFPLLVWFSYSGLMNANDLREVDSIIYMVFLLLFSSKKRKFCSHSCGW